MQEQLRTFIDAAKRAGAADSFLATLLEEAGWPKKEIWLAFSDHYSALTGLAIPRRPTGVESAKDAFFHLLAFCTLATWTGAMGSMLFTLINKWFSDALYTNTYLRSDYSVASELASILVAFPLYLFMMRMIGQAIAKQPEKLETGVRKWLTYIALLLAAGCLIGDLITFLNYLIRGEVSARFFCKVLVLLAIAGGVFGYYLQSLRTYDLSRNKIFAAVATAAAVLVVALGFLNLGPPSSQRALQADLRRVQDLQTITSAISRLKVVPNALPDIGFVLLDPVTRQPYEFRPIDSDNYEVCATFQLKFDDRSDLLWSHPAGRNCYRRNVGAYR